MSRRCKVLYGESSLDIENKINEWLRDNETAEILNVHYQRNHLCGHNVLIIYENNPYRFPPMPIQPYYPQPEPVQYPIITCDNKTEVGRQGAIKLYNDRVQHNTNPDPFAGTNIC